MKLKAANVILTRATCQRIETTIAEMKVLMPITMLR